MAAVQLFQQTDFCSGRKTRRPALCQTVLEENRVRTQHGAGPSGNPSPGPPGLAWLCCLAVRSPEGRWQRGSCCSVQ